MLFSQREELWSNWKNEGCPEFSPLNPLPFAAVEGNGSESSAAAAAGASAADKKATVAVGRPRRLKRTLGEQMKDAVKKSKCIIGK